MAVVQLFLNDIDQAPYQVAVVDVDDQTFIRGLPVFRVGTWNGKEKTADDLRTIAANFERIATVDKWQPPLKTRHTYEWDTGKPENVSVLDTTLGWFTALRYDEASETLLGDVRVVDYATIYYMRSGKLKYVSSELYDDYPLQTGEKIGKAFGGAAFVDIPAVKGLNWEIIVNAEQFAALAPGTAPGGGAGATTTTADGNGGPSNNDGTNGPQGPMTHSERPTGGDACPTTTTTGGGSNTMTLWERMKAMFGASDEQVAELQQLAAAEGVEPQKPGTPPVEQNAQAPTGAPAPQGGDPALVAQMAQMQKTIEEQGGQIQQMSATAVADKATTLVDELVRGRHLPPAQRIAAYALVHQALSTGATVQMLRAAGEGQEPAQVETPTVEALRELITGMGYAQKTGASGPALHYDGPDGLPDPNAPEKPSEKKLDEIAQHTGGKAKG